MKTAYFRCRRLPNSLLLPAVLAVLLRDVSATFNVLPAALHMQRDSNVGATQDSCTEQAVLRAHIPAEVLPLGTSGWTVTLHVQPEDVSGVVLCLPDACLKASAGALSLQDMAGDDLVDIPEVRLQRSTRTVSAIRQSNGTVVLCLDSSALSAAGDVLEGIDIARGITLGDPRSTNSLPAQYDALLTTPTAASSCSNAATMSADLPAPTPAPAPSLTSSRGSQMFIGEQTTISASVQHTAMVKLRITAYGLAAEPCQVAQCGNKVAVRAFRLAPLLPCNPWPVRCPCHVYII